MAGNWVRQLLREPLVHFLLAGLAVFLLASLRDQPVDPASRTITISEDQVSRLVTRWQAAWQRSPTPAEVDALIRDHIKEEVYYREALRLGLDEDDPIIRRRLRSKMEFLGGAAAENTVPDNATLQSWIDRNPARYAAAPRFSFDQIYLGADANAAAPLRARLKAGVEWTTLGERLSLPRSVESADRTAIDRQFGGGFAADLAALPVGGWQGPVASGFGAHLVRVRAVTAAAPPRLAEVRQAAENDWRAATRAERESKAYQALLDGYTIRIERP